MTYRGAVVDVDGTILRGKEPIPGAAEGLAALSAAGVRRLFVSNNPTKPPATYVERFADAAFDVAPEEVLTSGVVTTEYLREEHPDDRLYVVGAPGLVAQFEDAGLAVTDDYREGEVCVASIDHEFDYDRLTEALWLLQDGTVPLVGTDPDMVIPAARGDVPGSGAVVNAVAGVAGREPDAVLGKPHDLTRDLALDRLDCAPEECLVVGDRLDTDVALGDRAGMTTVLVRTGITDERALAESAVQPDYVLDSFGDIERVLDGG